MYLRCDQQPAIFYRNPQNPPAKKDGQNFFRIQHHVFPPSHQYPSKLKMLSFTRVTHFLKGEHVYLKSFAVITKNEWNTISFLQAFQQIFIQNLKQKTPGTFQ